MHCTSVFCNISGLLCLRVHPIQIQVDILTLKRYSGIKEPSNWDLGDNCIQIFDLGRYIVGYTVGNLALRRRVSGAVKRDFRTYIRRYTSPNENVLNTFIP